MALKQNGFEGQTSGTAITTTNSATSGDAFTALSKGSSSPVMQYSTAVAAHGSLSLLITPAAGDPAAVVYGGYTTSTGALRFYIRFPTLPSATIMFASVLNSSSNAMSKFYLDSTNKPLINDSATTLHTGTTAITANTWYRVELVTANGTSTSNGTINFGMYSLDSTTTFDSFSTTAANTTTTSVGSFQVGKIDTSAYATTFYVDDVAVNDGASSFIGPYATAPTANAGTNQTALEPWSTVTLDGSASTAVSPHTIASYAWTPPSGVTLSSTTASKPTFTAPASLSDQTYVFSLIVTDNAGATSSSSSVSITILAATEAWLSSAGVWRPAELLPL